MSVNATLIPEITATPNPLSLIPMQAIIIVAVAAIIGVAVLILVSWKFYANMGTKVMLRIHKNPDKTLRCRYYFHEFGNSVNESFKTPQEAADYIKRLLEGAFS